jgi:hypothetical protein
MRLKLHYQTRVYSLPPTTCLNTLLSHAVQAVPYLADEPFRLWFDDGEDRVILTCNSSLVEAYRLFPEVLRLGVLRVEEQLDIVPCRLQDEILPIKLIRNRLQAVARVSVGEQFRGLGCLISEGVLLTAAAVLPDASFAQSATVQFHTSSFPLHLAPDKLWEVSNSVVLVSLQCSYSVCEVEPLEFSVCAVPDSQFVATLKDAEADAVKWHFLKKLTEERLVYACNSPGAVLGGPVFGDKWQFLGIQLSAAGRQHQAARCADILNSLKSAPYSSSTVALIQLLEPVPTHEDSYFTIARDTPDPLAERVFGVPGLNQSWLVCYNVRSNTLSKVSFPERLSEGVSVCQLPNALFVSGGKDFKRKCWIGFLVGAVRWYKSEMLKSHYTHASLSYNNLVYVIGGRHSARPVRNVEAFEYLSRTWKPIQDLRHDRSYPSAVEFRGEIYVLGGRNDTKDLDDIEIFNGHRWRLCVFKLPLQLYGAGVFGLDEDKLIVCGGSREGLNYNRRVFTLDVTTNTCTPHHGEVRVGLCSSSAPLYSLDSIVFVSAEGSLYRFCRHSQRVLQLRHEVLCAMD